MLLAFELEKAKFGDFVDDMGRDGSNGIPDILDEAKWGLDWIHKLHPKADQLFHQVADDRDHRGSRCRTRTMPIMVGVRIAIGHSIRRRQAARPEPVEEQVNRRRKHRRPLSRRDGSRL